jgi:NAD(P)H-dependent flavin oxidoreductase YrpB (nitropropane dioxygenase family)
MSVTLKTELCDRIGIEYPVISAGMGPVAGTGDPVATAELVAAVSNAGGLGVIGGVAYPPDRLREEIRKVRSLTDKPFGVDLLLSSNFLVPRPKSQGGRSRPAPKLPAESLAAVREIAEEIGIEWQEEPRSDADGMAGMSGSWVPEGQSWAGSQMEVVLEEEVPVFASGLGSPARNRRAALQVAEGGADFVVAQGTEAGGHTGRIGTLALLPQVMDAVAPIPVLAAGGVASGRALAGVLALGAVGAWCGTVFLVSEEANQPDLQKQRILDASTEDTIVTRMFSGKTMRNISNPLIEAWERKGLQALPMGAQGLLVRDLLYSVRQAGRPDLLMNAAGQTSGMLTKKRPAGEILREMVGEAAEILGSKLSQHVRAAV